MDAALMTSHLGFSFNTSVEYIHKLFHLFVTRHLKSPFSSQPIGMIKSFKIRTGIVLSEILNIWHMILHGGQTFVFSLVGFDQDMVERLVVKVRS